MITLNNVSFHYGDAFGPDEPEGVEQVNLSVEPGQCVVLCGRSGCGKSTVLRLVNGLAPSFYPGKLSGEVHVAGKTPGALAPEERTRLMGVVFQDPRSQFFMEHVRDELAFSCENLGMEPERIRRLIRDQAERFELVPLLDRPLGMLSSGQKQRVAIAAASLLAPPLLVLDEPIANLDERSAQSLLRVLADLKRSGTTLLVSEHRLHALLPIADAFICMEGGRIVKRWTGAEFARLPYGAVRPFGLRHPDMAGTAPRPRMPEETPPGGGWEGRRLAYRYKRAASGIRDADIVLPGASVTALTGDNGTGKTTLCKMLCGLLRQQRGAIASGGVRLSAGRRRAASCLVMQDADYQLYADSVSNEIVLGRAVTAGLRSKACEALEAFDLRGLKDRHPASLSGGQKQRVALAAAYCSDAELIVLDEPTSRLDGDNVLKVAAWTRQLAQSGKTVVVITHDKLLAELACDRTIRMTADGAGSHPVSAAGAVECCSPGL